jgi:hypothetical protein
MPSRLGWKMSDWVQLVKSAWRTMMRENVLAMSTRERATFCIQEFQGSQSVISQAPGQASLARLRGVAFAACTRRRETWVLVVQAVPSA